LTSDSWVIELWNHKAIQPVNLYFSAYAALPGDIYLDDVQKAAKEKGNYATSLALQLPFPKVSESMGNHDSKIVDAGGVD
jgi:hypothetical protein